MDKQHSRLLSGSIRKHILHLSLPMAIGIVAIFMSNLIDAFYVGKLGTNQLAALGFVFPITFALMSVALGLGVGTSSIISRTIGQGDLTLAKRITQHALILAVFIVTSLAVMGMVSIDELFMLFGPTPVVLEHIRDYMEVWYLGIGFVVIPMVGNSAIRATGDTLIPGIIMGLSALFNIILDPLLIFGIGPFPEMALKGAAWATVLSWIGSFVLAIWFLIVHKKLVSAKLPTFKQLWSSWGKILYIGLPVAMTNMLNPIAIGIVTKIVATKGTAAVAAYGIGTRIEPIALVIILALTGALPPIVGQNWGAKLFHRVKDAMHYGLKISVVTELTIYILLASFAGPIVSLFTTDPQVILYAKWFMWIVPLGYAGHSVLLITSTVLNAINKPLHAGLLNICRIFLCILPLSYIGSTWYTVSGIFTGLTIAELIMGTVSLTAAYKITQHLNKKSTQKKVIAS